jgi:hypothetical protein
MKKLLLPILSALALSQNVFAGTGVIEPVQIEGIAVIATAYGSHIAGNMEIKIKNGFIPPLGVSCDTNFITTKKTIDPDRAMLTLLQEAKTAGRNVRLYITNDSANTAYPGRCSLIAVDVR